MVTDEDEGMRQRIVSPVTLHFAAFASPFFSFALAHAPLGGAEGKVVHRGTLSIVWLQLKTLHDCNVIPCSGVGVGRRLKEEEKRAVFLHCPTDAPCLPRPRKAMAEPNG